MKHDGRCTQCKWLRRPAHSAWLRGVPHVRGQGQRPRVPGCNGAGTAERSHPTSQIRGGGREEPPRARGQGRRLGRSTHVQGVVAALAQEGLEELSHVEGQEGRLGGHTLHPRKGAAAVLCWSSREEIPHAQGKRNPRKLIIYFSLCWVFIAALVL